MSAMRWTLNTQIFLGALFGLATGLLLQSQPSWHLTPSILFVFELIGKIFINLLKMVLVPLIFTSIVAGIANLLTTRSGHKVWSLFLLYSLMTSALAVVTGLIAVNVFKPGVGLNVPWLQQQTAPLAAHPVTLNDFVRKLIDGALANPVSAMADNNVLGIIVFAAFLGAALVALGPRASTLLKLTNELFEVVMTIVGWIMRLAPLGVMALLATLVAGQNLSLLHALSAYILLVLGATLFHGLVTLPAILWIFTRISPAHFFYSMRHVFLTAFSTSSSNATLPVTMRAVTQELRVDKNIAGFVLPVGATVNMDGTALYEAMAALFVANLCGIHLDLLQQIVVALMAMLAAIGAPGIPSAGMVTLMMVLQSVGLPIEAVALLIPIDRPLDTVRTVVNVEGDCVGACVVQKLL